MAAAGKSPTPLDTTVSPEFLELDHLLFDVEDRCGRAVLVIRETVARLCEPDSLRREPAILQAALEMVESEMDQLVARALKARTEPPAEVGPTTPVGGRTVIDLMDAVKSSLAKRGLA